MEMQRMLDGTVEPVGAHRDDIVVCEDGGDCPRLDAFTDCRGRYYRDEDERDEANNDIVAELLDAESAWCDEYVASDDYGDGYAYIVCEGHHDWDGPIASWLDETYNDGKGWNARPLYGGSVAKALVASIAQLVHDYDDFESKYSRNEYACYSGKGCCISSFGVGEYETQIDIAGRDEFEVLNDEGALEGCLASYNGDLYLHCNDRYDKASGKRVRTGYVSHNTFWGTSGGHGVWHYVVSDDSMEEYLCRAIVEYCERVDGNG
jgi:hypothetical protein